ncbi:MAG: DUF3592 domain-containing protein [Chromatiales bacterium]|jgi:hypothetical protein
MTPNDTTPGTGTRRPAALRFFAVILTAFGLFLILPSQCEIERAREAADWEPREARITHSEVARYGGGRAEDPPRYRADIRGVMLDSDRAFQIERIGFARIGTGSEVREYVRRYPEGEVVQVYVSPEDPDRVVLVRDASPTPMYLLQAAGAASIAIAVLLLLRARRLRGERESTGATPR